MAISKELITTKLAYVPCMEHAIVHPYSIIVLS